MLRGRALARAMSAAVERMDWKCMVLVDVGCGSGGAWCRFGGVNDNRGDYNWYVLLWTKKQTDVEGIQTQRNKTEEETSSGE